MIEVDIFPSRHPLWRSIIDKPPEGVRYLERVGRVGRLHLLVSGLVGVRRLVHFCNGVKLAYLRRWVADMESVKVFFRDYSEMVDSECVSRAQRRIETGECRALMPLTKAAKKTLEKYLSLKNYYVEVVHPSFYMDNPPDMSKERPLLVFVGGSWLDKSFEAKGGREVAEAWLRMAGKYSFRLMMFSSPPPELAKRLAEKGVHVGGVERDALLREIYPRARLIILPSMMDTVGYSVIEAMYFGAVPVVSDHFAMPEIVGDAGAVVKTPNRLWKDDGTHDEEFRKKLDEGPYEELVERLVDVVHVLLDDDDYWGTLSVKASLRIRTGPLSVEERNRKLKQIYMKALE
ncbi:MAG: glycosyltransferase [Candidatus Caldarchaeum sp.]